MSKNSTLRDLFEAIQKGDRSAALPLADHLEELGAIDLAAPIREFVPLGGRCLIGAISEVFDVCHEDIDRGLLSWEDEPHERRTLALYQAVLALSLGNVPVLTGASDLGDSGRRVRLARLLFDRLELRGLQVEVWGSDRSVMVSIPGLEWVEWHPTSFQEPLDSRQYERMAEEDRVAGKLSSILAHDFPGLGEQRFCISRIERPDRWRIPREQWQTPEEAKEEAEKVRTDEVRAARAAEAWRRGSGPAGRKLSPMRPPRSVLLPAP
jgi:hypothetical protein